MPAESGTGTSPSRQDIEMVNAPETLSPAAPPRTPALLPHSSRSAFQSDSLRIVDIPLSILNRPLESVLDMDKVETFKRDIQNGDQMTPLEVFRVRTPDAKTYFISYGGCHRYEAYRQLETPTVRARIIDAPPSMMRTILGKSSPF